MPIAPIDVSPETESGYEEVRLQLRERFAAWSTASGAILAPDVGEELLHYKWGYLDRHLTRWTRSDLDAVFLEMYPAKMIVDDGELDQVLVEAATFVRFLADTGLLDPASEDPEVLYDHLEQIGPRFHLHMADAVRYSMGKRVLMEATARGVRLDDWEAMQDFIQAFNASPLAEREAVLGPPARPVPAKGGTGRFTPPGTPPRRKPSNRHRPRRR
ncbi:hypothetical protein K6U06_05740 [Acidiferrimicrobium sp. IK]|uniref:hypothetical protein n=1 Tax=Acidiferrimicrobium sp. IK TaxID=2871700 RepID=UPI0021CAE8E8|nr:hypothetical protein [Acidiferrimicrobium sp. IK]MCU4183854.1 hypothetical protein [Acidiferrimicrobium sp. IK]